MPAEDPELLGTAFGLLTNELAQSPEASIEAVLRLLEQVGRRMQSTFKASGAALGYARPARQHH